jgi:hypothetical protein
VPVKVLCPGCQEIFVFDPTTINAGAAGEEAPPTPDFIFTPRALAEADLPKRASGSGRQQPLSMP